MSGPILRHAGSANPDRAGSSFGNPQFAGLGSSKICDDCRAPHSFGSGWKKWGPGGVLYRCPQCVIERAARKSGVDTEAIL